MRRNVSSENLREAGRSEKRRCEWEYHTKVDTKEKRCGMDLYGITLALVTCSFERSTHGFLKHLSKY